MMPEFTSATGRVRVFCSCLSGSVLLLLDDPTRASAEFHSAYLSLYGVISLAAHRTYSLSRVDLLLLLLFFPSTAQPHLAKEPSPFFATETGRQSWSDLI